MTPADGREPAEPHARYGDPEPLPVDRRASHDARVQEMKAGAAPLVRIIPIAARTPRGSRPGAGAIATVPFLTVAAVRWSRVTVGDTIGRLVHLLQERGGLWLAKHTTTSLTWTVSDAERTEDDTSTSASPWIRLDATFTGAWSGRFSLAASAPRLASNLWCVATSPLVGILPDEAADKALPPVGGDAALAWKPFTEALDNSVHTTTRPPLAIRDLVVRSAWDGADRLSQPDQ